MLMNRLLTILLCALCLTACEKQPAELDFADKDVEMLNEGKEAIYKSKPYTGLVRNKHSNGKVAGESKPGGFFFVDLAPGTVEVLTSTEVEKKLTLTLDAGQTRYVRTTVGFGVLVYRVYPELVDDKVGAKEIAETSYIGKPLPKP